MKLGKPQPSTPAYYGIPIGIHDAWICVKINTERKILKADVYFKDKDLFLKVMNKDRLIIERKIRSKLYWDEMPQSKGAIVGKSLSFDLENEKKWKDYFKWLKDISEKLQKIFLKSIKDNK